MYVCVVNFSKQRRKKLVYYRWINDRSDRVVSSVAKHYTTASPSFTMKRAQLKKKKNLQKVKTVRSTISITMTLSSNLTGT